MNVRFRVAFSFSSLTISSLWSGTPLASFLALLRAEGTVGAQYRLDGIYRSDFKLQQVSKSAGIWLTGRS